MIQAVYGTRKSWPERPDFLFRLSPVDAPAQTDLEGHFQPVDIFHLFSDQGRGRGSPPFRKVLSMAVRSGPPE